MTTWQTRLLHSQPSLPDGYRSLATAVHRGDAQWDLSANGGTLNASGWPAFQIDQAAGSYQSAAITVSQAKLVVPTGGSIVVNGSVNLEGKRPYKFHGDLAGLSLSDFPPTKWHLQGLASGSLDFTGDLAEPDSGQIIGSVHLDKAKLDWSLLLGKVRSLVKQLGLNDWQLDGVDVQINRQGQHLSWYWKRLRRCSAKRDSARPQRARPRHV